MRWVALLPLRGGSKSIPGKNLRIIAGRQRSVQSRDGGSRVEDLALSVRPQEHLNR